MFNDRQTLYHNGFAIPTDWDGQLIVDAVRIINYWSISAFVDGEGQEVAVAVADNNNDDDTSADLHFAFYVEFPTAGRDEDEVTSFVMRPVCKRRKLFEAFPIIEGDLSKFDAQFWKQTKVAP